MKRKLIYIIAALMVALSLLAGCSSGEPAGSPSPEASTSSPQVQEPAETTGQPAEPSGEPAGGIELTDMSGRTVTLDKPATKVVAVTPADCEILYTLGAGDALIGRGEYCDWPEEVLEVTSVQSGQDLNVETIIAMEPELVLMSTMDHSMDVVDQMTAAGIPVITTQTTNIDGVYSAITLIGKAVGKDAEAEQLIADMKGALDSIKAEAPAAEGDKKTIYFEVSPLEYGLWTAGGNTFMDEIATMLNLENLFADLDGWAEVSEEQVIERNPDYIVTITMYFGEGPEPVDEIAGRNGWDGITAVKDGKIFQANSDELSRPGPRLVDGARALLSFVSE